MTNLWYSHTEHYERESKRKHWKKSHSLTYKLSRKLRSAIIENACHAWWAHVCGRGIERHRAVRYWEDRKPAAAMALGQPPPTQMQ